MLRKCNTKSNNSTGVWEKKVKREGDKNETEGREREREREIKIRVKEERERMIWQGEKRENEKYTKV